MKAILTHYSTLLTYEMYYHMMTDLVLRALDCENMYYFGNSNQIQIRCVNLNLFSKMQKKGTFYFLLQDNRH